MIVFLPGHNWYLSFCALGIMCFKSAMWSLMERTWCTLGVRRYDQFSSVHIALCKRIFIWKLLLSRISLSLWLDNLGLAVLVLFTAIWYLTNQKNRTWSMQHSVFKSFKGCCQFSHKWPPSLSLSQDMYPKGVIPLAAIQMARIAKDNKFEVVTSHRTFVFRADNEGKHNPLEVKLQLSCNEQW